MSPEELEEVRAYGRMKSAEFRARKKEKEAAEEAAAAASAAAVSVGTSDEKVNQENLIDKNGIEKENTLSDDIKKYDEYQKLNLINRFETAAKNRQTKPTKLTGNVFTGKVFKCSCGADIFPDENGEYPDFCSACGSENDYRGIAFFENSTEYIICDNCGKVSKYHPGMKSCPKCHYGGL